MAMDEVFQHLDQAKEAVEPELFAELAGATATDAGRLLRVTRALGTIQQVLATLGDAFADQGRAVAVLTQGSEDGGRHIGQAIVHIGGEPNQGLMEALDRVSSTADSSRSMRDMYASLNDKAAEARAHADALSRLVGEMTTQNLTVSEEAEKGRQQWYGAQEAIRAYEEGAGRSS